MNSGALPPSKNTVTEDRRWSRQAIQNTFLISGRYLLANGEEYPCRFRCVTISRGEVISPIAGNPGEIIICYIDRVGIILGIIEHIISGGMSVAFNINQTRHSRILSRLEWHAARELELFEMRNGARIVPVHTDVLIKISDDYFLSGEIIDISLSGASISLTAKKTPGRWSNCECRTTKS